MFEWVLLRRKEGNNFFKGQLFIKFFVTQIIIFVLKGNFYYFFIVYLIRVDGGIYFRINWSYIDN